jgi:hypothetical protein
MLILKINRMKKLILMLITLTNVIAINAQGVRTVQSNDVEVPLNQWYVIRDKDFDNHSFFYGDLETVINELKSILEADDQSIEFPKGKDESGDDYWLVLNENEYLSRIYLTREKETKMATITIYTE